MSELTISAAVMCHPSRRSWADALAREISDLRPVAAEDPRPDDAPSTIRTALRAWEAIRPDASHHLVLQDDVLLAERFVEQVAAAAARFPDSILALYSTWYTANGSATRLAALSDADWVEAVPGDYVPTQALLVPRQDVMRLIEMAREADTSEVDDHLVRDHVLSSGRQALLSIPNLVEHREGPSILDGATDRRRRATCFVNAATTSARRSSPTSFSTLPCLSRGLAHVHVIDRADDRVIWYSLSWRAYLQEAGLWGSTHAYVDGEPATPCSSPSTYSAYQRELTATAFLLGALSESGSHEAEPLLRECLRTLVLGGAEGTAIAAQVNRDEAALIATAADGLRRGRALRQRIGQLPTIDTGGLLRRRCGRQSRAPGRYWIE